MLKITLQIESGVLLFGLEGELAGPWVKELEQCWRSATVSRQGSAVRVDLSSATFIDEEGKELLKEMHRQGAELVASGCLNKCIVEGIVQSAEKKA